MLQAPRLVRGSGPAWLSSRPPLLCGTCPLPACAQSERWMVARGSAPRLCRMVADDDPFVTGEAYASTPQCVWSSTQSPGAATSLTKTISAKVPDRLRLSLRLDSKHWQTPERSRAARTPFSTVTP
eukprot:324194-Rhodomonas_salina.1